MSDSDDVDGEAESIVRFARRDADDIAWLALVGMTNLYVYSR